MISRVTPDLDLIGAYSYLDARVQSGDNAGKRVETVPGHQASLWAKYRLTALGLQGVTVGGGVRYIGESWDGLDAIRTPDYTLFDAMIRYETGPWRFQVNATNLADKRHVTTCLARGDCFLASVVPCWVVRRTGSRGWKAEPLFWLRPVRIQKQPRRAVDHTRMCSADGAGSAWNTNGRNSVAWHICRNCAAASTQSSIARSSGPTWACR